MVGADLAFAIQNNAMFAYEQDIKNMSRRYEDYVMLYLLSSIIKRFEQGEVPETLQQMTKKNQLPIRLVSQLLERLEDSNIIRRIYIENEEEQAFVPAMDTRKITVDLVMGQISALGTEEFLQNTPEEMQVFWKRYLELVQSNPTNILVSDLT
jgi:membrane protein